MVSYCLEHGLKSQIQNNFNNNIKSDLKVSFPVTSTCVLHTLYIKEQAELLSEQAGMVKFCTSNNNYKSNIRVIDDQIMLFIYLFNFIFFLGGEGGLKQIWSQPLG